MRVPNWKQLYAREIEAALLRPFIWGQWDCCQFVATVTTAITGTDRREIFPAYTSEAEALAIINECGGFSALLSRAFGEPMSNKAFAKKGDVMLCDFGRGPQPAICDGVWCVTTGEKGLVKRMSATATEAWDI